MCLEKFYPFFNSCTTQRVQFNPDLTNLFSYRFSRVRSFFGFRSKFPCFNSVFLVGFRINFRVRSIFPSLLLIQHADKKREMCTQRKASMHLANLLRNTLKTCYYAKNFKTSTYPGAEEQFFGASFLDFSLGNFCEAWSGQSIRKWSYKSAKTVIRLQTYCFLLLYDELQTILLISVPNMRKQNSRHPIYIL